MGDSGILWPTWLMAGASVVNLIVLAAYAYFTWGIWSETRRSARRTEELAKATYNAVLLQFVAILVQERNLLQERHGTTPARTRFPWRTFDDLWELFRKLLPEEWARIERIEYGIPKKGDE